MGLRNTRVALAKRMNRIPSPVIYRAYDNTADCIGFPDVFAVRRFTLTAPSQQLVTFNPLEQLVPLSVDMLQTPGLHSIPARLETQLTEVPIAVLEYEISEHLVLEIEDFLDPICKPRISGKAYRNDDDDAVQLRLESSQESRGIKTVDLSDLSLYCKHGLTKSLCQFCRQEAYKKRQSKQPTVDVFEQLRYILQPPILERLGQPEVFPEGRGPYPFQISGIKWLLDHPAALLADDMGLGKTIQVIVAMRILFNKGHLQKVLIICPAGLRTNWYREIQKWAPELNSLRILASPDVRAEQWKTPVEVFIVSYDTLAKDIDLVPSKRFDMCILDEAQNIKNPDTARARSIRRLEPNYRWALTGTPLENKVEDTVAIFRFVQPSLFGPNEAPPPQALKSAIAPFTLRRNIADVESDLPDRTHREHWIDLGDMQRIAYQGKESEGVSRIRSLEGQATRVHVFSLIQQLKQICNYDEQSGESSKMDFLEEELDKVTSRNEKALVFSQYPNKTLDKIKPYLDRFTPQVYNGSLNDRERTRVVEKFQNEEEHKVLLIGVKSGGTGLTLTRANHVYHFDHWWNPAVVDQASARIYRIGQERDVFIHSLYTTDTIEEKIANLLKDKKKLFSDVFGELEDKQAVERLSDQDLFGLFDLEVPTNEKISSINTMDPTDFEKLIQRLFQNLGYDTSVTKRSHDGGVDLRGSATGFGRQKIIVQCKRYSGSVSVGHVRELLGVMSTQQEVSQGFLVTTGRFTKEAERLVAGQRVRLINGIELGALLQQHKVL